MDRMIRRDCSTYSTADCPEWMQPWHKYYVKMVPPRKPHWMVHIALVFEIDHPPLRMPLCRHSPPPVFIYASEAEPLKTIVHPVSPIKYPFVCRQRRNSRTQSNSSIDNSIIGKTKVQLQVKDLVRKRSLYSNPRSVAHRFPFELAEELRHSWQTGIKFQFDVKFAKVLLLRPEDLCVGPFLTSFEKDNWMRELWAN